MTLAATAWGLDPTPSFAEDSFGPPSDSIFTAGSQPSQVALEIAALGPHDSPERVVIARDDTFADALASGGLQASAPLLLVGRDEVPGAVLERVRALDPTEVVLLGGEAALSRGVADTFASAGFVVTRRAGPTRVETATVIAATDLPTATTAVLLRSTAGGDPTRAFADSLAAGALAAQHGWPVLLTSTDQLSVATRSYLERSVVEHVVIVGGTAAVSSASEAAVTSLGIVTHRISGANRGATAAAVAAVRGVTAEGPVVVVAGDRPDGWVGGFASAGYAAATGAPIVLATRLGLPEASAELLDDAGPPGTVDGPRVVCTASLWSCGEARQRLGLPPVSGHVIDAGCDWSFGGPPRLSDDGRILAVSFPQQRCEEVHTPFRNAVLVADAYTGSVRFVDVGEYAVEDVALSASGGVMYDGSVVDLRPDQPVSLGYLGAITDGHNVSADGATVAAMETALSTTFVPPSGGEFYDLATGTYTGPNSCVRAFAIPGVPEDERSCSGHRVISPDGRFVFTTVGHAPPDRRSYHRGLLRVGRDGSEAYVPLPLDAGEEIFCSSAHVPARDGSFSVHVCDRDQLIVTDFEARSARRVDLDVPERGDCTGLLTSMSDDGWLAFRGCDVLYNFRTDEATELPDTWYRANAISRDGRWISTIDRDGVRLLPSPTP